MNHDHSTASQPLPADYIRERRAGWKAFTHFTVLQCVAVAALLLLMLIFLRIL